MHMTNREIIPGRKKKDRHYSLQTVTIADTLISSVNVVSRLAGRWMAQHTVPVRTKPDSRPRLEEGGGLEIPDKLFTFY